MLAPMARFYCGEALCKTAVTVPAGASPPWPIRCPACGTALYPTDVLDRLPPSEFEPKRAELMIERGGRRVAVASRELGAPRQLDVPRPASAPDDDADRILAMVDLGPTAPADAPGRGARPAPASSGARSLVAEVTPPHRPASHSPRRFVVPALVVVAIAVAVVVALLMR
jgi:hypothetical protein